MKPAREVAHELRMSHGLDARGEAWLTAAIETARRDGAEWMRDQAEIAVGGLRFGAPTWRSAAEVVRALPLEPNP